MVRAILEGRKTQTRRVVKKVGRDNCLPDRRVTSAFGAVVHVSQAAELCPYGQPGDQLWVREAWAEDCDWIHKVFFRADNSRYDFVGNRQTLPLERQGEISKDDSVEKWKPSIHMPREHSRLSLEITAVRAERIKDITDADSQAEGSEACDHIDTHGGQRYRCTFQQRWTDLNGKRGFGWHENPWVWVIGFRVIA